MIVAAVAPTYVGLTPIATHRRGGAMGVLAQGAAISPSTSPGCKLQPFQAIQRNAALPSSPAIKLAPDIWNVKRGSDRHMENYQAAREQSHSSPPPKTTTRYRGVRLRKWGSWVAEVRLPNSRERLWLGSYATAEQAARAFDAAVYCLRGPCAAFNFPVELPNIPHADTLSKEEIRAAAAQFALEGRRGNGEEKGQAAVSSEVRKQEEVSAVEYYELPDVARRTADWWDGKEDAEDWDGLAGASDDIYSVSPLWNF